MSQRRFIARGFLRRQATLFLLTITEVTVTFMIGNEVDGRLYVYINARSVIARYAQGTL